MLHPVQEAYIEWLEENRLWDELDYYIELIHDTENPQPLDFNE